MFDNNEYKQIVETYRKQLYLYCFCRLRNDEYLADEVLNDVFIILFEKWDLLDRGDNIRAYLYRVADNCIKNALRENDKYYRHNVPMDTFFSHGGNKDAVYEDEYFKTNLGEDDYMQKIEESLPEEYKEIFRLRFVEKKTLESIAKQMGMLYSSLRLRISKIEAIIHKEIEKNKKI